jgi:hypothetical protein
VILVNACQDEDHRYESTEEFKDPNLKHQLNAGKTFYTSERNYVFPLNGYTADQNAPTFLWPLNDKHKPGAERTSHRVFVVTSPDFDRDQIIVSPLLKWAIFRPDHPLAPIIQEKDSDIIKVGNWEITADITPESEASFQLIASDTGKRLTLQPDGELAFEHAELKKTIEPLVIKKKWQRVLVRISCLARIG